MAVILIGSGRPGRIGYGFLLPVRRIAIGEIILLERRSLSALNLLQTAGKKVDILGNAVFPLGARSTQSTSRCGRTGKGRRVHPDGGTLKVARCRIAILRDRLDRAARRYRVLDLAAHEIIGRVDRLEDGKSAPARWHDRFRLPCRELASLDLYQQAPVVVGVAGRREFDGTSPIGIDRKRTRLNSS